MADNADNGGGTMAAATLCCVESRSPTTAPSRPKHPSWFKLGMYFGPPVGSLLFYCFSFFVFTCQYSLIVRVRAEVGFYGFHSRSHTKQQTANSKQQTAVVLA